MLKKSLLALALAGSVVTAQADVLLQENFDNVASLQANGWILNNASAAPGTTSWYQGDQAIFGAYNGAPEAYIAANFNSASAGGTLANWLITPVFSTATNVLISFWAKADQLENFADNLAYGVSTGSADLSAFSLLPSFVVRGDWTRYTLALNAQGAGSTARFAIQYGGPADAANYVGIDALDINTVGVNAVPEPASVLLFGAGMLGLMGLRRRKQAR